MQKHAHTLYKRVTNKNIKNKIQGKKIKEAHRNEIKAILFIGRLI